MTNDQIVLLSANYIKSIIIQGIYLRRQYTIKTCSIFPTKGQLLQSSWAIPFKGKYATEFYLRLQRALTVSLVYGVPSFIEQDSLLIALSSQLLQYRS